MTNFNAIAIPIMNTPGTPPPAGTKLIYFKPNGNFTELDASGKETRLARPVFEQNITLSEEFTITEVRSTNQVVITVMDIAKFNTGDIILITDSTRGTNNGTYTIEEVEEETPDPAFTENPGDPNSKILVVNLLESNLDTTLAVNGKLHIKKRELVNHNLSARAVFFTLINEDTDEYVQITPKRNSTNQLEFNPDVPVLGNLLVSITL